MKAPTGGGNKGKTAGRKVLNMFHVALAKSVLAKATSESADSWRQLVAKEQNWKCLICRDSLFNSEEIEAHHIVPVKEGGTDDKENLIHMHRACHIHVAKLKAF